MQRRHCSGAYGWRSRIYLTILLTPNSELLGAHTGAITTYLRLERIGSNVQKDS